MHKIALLITPNTFSRQQKPQLEIILSSYLCNTWDKCLTEVSTAVWSVLTSHPFFLSEITSEIVSIFGDKSKSGELDQCDSST